MARIVVIFDMKRVSKDGTDLDCVGASADRFDALVAAQGHTMASAIQWYGSTGDIEWLDAHNEDITESDIAPYSNFFDTEYALWKQEMKEAALNQSAEALAKIERNSLLAKTDWWATSDRTMTDDQKAYRQALRDLPASPNWSPRMSWVEDEEIAVVVGVTWPIKPLD